MNRATNLSNFFKLSLVVGSLLLAGANEANAAPCVTASCTERPNVIDGKRIQIHRSYPLLSVNTNVTRAIIAIHGASKSVDGLFDAVIDAGGSKINETQIIVPLFKEGDEAPLSDDLYWDSGWRRGSMSLNPGSRTGSYDVLDFFIRILSDKTRYPNLKQITVAGHSAGGQVVARYSIGTQMPNSLTSYQYNFVIANPSSYMYLDEYRPYNAAMTEFRIPVTNCADYNIYGYGMVSRNTYMNRQTQSALIQQFRNRNVKILAGTEDTLRDPDLDKSCEADLQGLNRYERAHGFFNHIRSRYPSSSHSIQDVQGVDHAQGAMFRSSVGAAALYPAISAANPMPTPTPVPPATPPPTPTPSTTSKTLRVKVIASADDAEQSSSGVMDLTSTALELVTNGTQLQQVGLRFKGISIPQGAVIEQAYIAFTADQANSEATSLSFQGQKSTTTGGFTTTSNNISGRVRTTAKVSWPSVPAWTAVGAVYNTPNLAPIVQEIVSQSGWVSGNSLILFVNGSGKRVAESFDGSSSLAPVLVIQYR